VGRVGDGVSDVMANWWVVVVVVIMMLIVMGGFTIYPRFGKYTDTALVPSFSGL
jgi:hypothetical protein